MTIKQDSKVRLEDNNGYDVQGWQVHCDACGHTSSRPGTDAGEAAEYARKEGFVTKPNGIYPSLWLCHVCGAKQKKVS
jgi:hypothetical protein